MGAVGESLLILTWAWMATHIWVFTWLERAIAFGVDIISIVLLLIITKYVVVAFFVVVAPQHGTDHR